jgi:hypothetical protein
VLSKAAERRHADPSYEHDRDRDEENIRDRDEENIVRTFPTEAAALSFARQIVAAKETFYGAAHVTRQRYEPIPGTLYSDWENVGESEEVS